MIYYEYEEDELIRIEADLTSPKELFTIDEAVKGNLGGKGKSKVGICYLKIKSNEGPIPHFHIDSKDGKFHCCVCLYEPLYFHHLQGEKELSSDQKAILNDILSKDNNWKKLSDQWIDAYGDNPEFKKYCKEKKINIKDEEGRKKLSMPDYTSMNKSIHL